MLNSSQSIKMFQWFRMTKPISKVLNFISADPNPSPPHELSFEWKREKWRRRRKTKSMMCTKTENVAPKYYYARCGVDSYQKISNKKQAHCCCNRHSQYTASSVSCYCSMLTCIVVIIILIQWLVNVRIMKQFAISFHSFKLCTLLV